MADSDSEVFLGGRDLGVGGMKPAPCSLCGALGFSATLVELLARRRPFSPTSQEVFPGCEYSELSAVSAVRPSGVLD